MRTKLLEKAEYSFVLPFFVPARIHIGREFKKGLNLAGLQNLSSMKFFLLVFGFLLNISMMFGQSFEGKLTYLHETRSGIDTQYAYIRGDSIRIDLPKWLDASTSWYFIGKNQHFIYSKWKKAYLESPIIQPDQIKEVLAYDLKSAQDSITLYFQAKTLNTELNIETTISSFLKLHPQLKVPFLKGTFIQSHVLNGSGYIMLESNTDLQFNVLNEKRYNRSRLIAIDHTKPSIELFEIKSN